MKNKKEANDNSKLKKRILFIVMLVVLALIVTIIGLLLYNNYIKQKEKSNSTVQKSTHTHTGIYPSIFGDTPTEKPIVYLYPERTTELSVTLGKPENVACSYPQYDKDGWQVVASPDGSLVDKDTGRSLYALYWEGISKKFANFDDGFVVKKEDTISFLEDKLAILGLNERESEEFIVYWLPRLQENEYNLIRFETMDEINEDMPLNFSVQPDSIIRVMMDWKGLDKPIDVKEQVLTTPERNGFVAVEWGGSEIK